jgi:hypothetical protein
VSGRLIAISRSRRPARFTAGSMFSGWFEAATTTTPGRSSTPASSSRNRFTTWVQYWTCSPRICARIRDPVEFVDEQDAGGLRASLSERLADRLQGAGEVVRCVPLRARRRHQGDARGFRQGAGETGLADARRPRQQQTPIVDVGPGEASDPIGLQVDSKGPGPNPWPPHTRRAPPVTGPSGDELTLTRRGWPRSARCLG